MVSGPCNRRWDRRDQLVMDHMAHDLITLRSKITLILARGIIRGELHFITFIADSYIDIEFYCHWRQAQRPRINRVIIPDGDLIGSFRIRAVAFLRFNLIIQGTGWDVFCIQASVRIHILDACPCPRFYFINEGRLPCGLMGGHSYITCCDDRYSMDIYGSLSVSPSIRLTSRYHSGRGDIYMGLLDGSCADCVRRTYRYRCAYCCQPIVYLVCIRPWRAWDFFRLRILGAYSSQLLCVCDAIPLSDM